MYALVALNKEEFTMLAQDHVDVLWLHISTLLHYHVFNVSNPPVRGVMPIIQLSALHVPSIEFSVETDALVLKDI